MLRSKVAFSAKNREPVSPIFLFVLVKSFFFFLPTRQLLMSNKKNQPDEVQSIIYVLAYLSWELNKHYYNLPYTRKTIICGQEKL
jgi:hypothetical protein